MSNFQEVIGDIGLMIGGVYLKNLLYCYSEVTEGGLGSRDALHASDEIKKLYRQFNIQINNSNLEVYPTTVYRLYKDSKFFGELGSVIGNGEMKSLLSELSKIIK